jgi:hypothetical protein
MAKKAKARRPAPRKPAARKSSSRKPAARKPNARATAGGLDKHTQQLHSFFHSLYKNPDLMHQFTSGAEGRDQALASTKLSDPHKALLKKGCVPEILHALVGAPATQAFASQMIDCVDTIACGHPECAAFTNAIKK